MNSGKRQFKNLMAAKRRGVRFAMVLAFALALLADSRVFGSEDMALIPGGIYQPLFRASNAPAAVRVRPFRLDVVPVSNARFLEFVRANPQWRRSQVARAMADETYLRDWAGDFELGPNVSSNAPVTFVSWHAANSYARWRGKRLPTTAEWEIAAAASATRADGANDPAFVQRVLQWYVTPAERLGDVGRQPPNFFGVRDLHGLIWEWTGDFAANANGDGGSAGAGARERFCGGAAQGARDASDYPSFMRFSFRSSLKPEYTIHNLGFRCAADASAR